MDDKLKQVLHKVELLCDQNPEFAAALRNKLSVTVVSYPVSVQDERIGKIEKYLGLDYKLDDINPVDTHYCSIDYSFIPQESIHNQLESDFREMLRFRYGTRSHKTDFYEFCKFAHFQIEALLNEYLRMKFCGDMSKVKAFINKNNENYQTIEEIAYTYKLTPTLVKMGLSAYKDKDNTLLSIQHKNGIPIQFRFSNVIRYISYVRNDCNHRGEIIDKQNVIDAFLGNPKYKNVYHDDGTTTRYYDFSNESDKDVQYYLWLLSTPWEDVIQTIMIFTKKIKGDLLTDKGL